MKRFILLWMLALYSFATFASAISWQVGNTKLNVVAIKPGVAVWLSPWCLEKKECDALRARAEVSAKATDPSFYKDELPGVNPGSVSCRKRFSAQVFLAHAAIGETQGFCRFADGSLISINAL